MNLFYMSFSSGCIVLFIIFLRHFFNRKLPVELFCVLWWLAIIRALVPFSFVSDFSVYNLNVALLVFSRQFSERVLFMDNNKMKLLSLIFIVFTIILTFVAIIVFSYFFKIHKNCKKIANASKHLNRDEKLHLKDINYINKGIVIKTSPYLDTPVSFGFFNPIIILPEDFDFNNKNLIEFVYLHESIHIRYFHYIWKLVSVITVCLHWFNPCIWLLYYYFEKDIEIFCDKRVIESLKENDRVEYAKTLISMAKQQQNDRGFYNNFVKKNILKERILIIMNFKKTSLATLVVSFCIISGTATAFATTDTIINLNSSAEDMFVAIEESDDKIIVINDQEKELELTYDEIEEYSTADDGTRASKSLYVNNYEYESNDGLPSKITVTVKKNGYTYKGTLKFTSGGITSSGLYIGYYSGYIYR